MTPPSTPSSGDDLEPIAARRLNDAIADRMLEQLAQSADLSRIHHTVQVTSFGGSGTTTLYDYLRDAGIDVPDTPGSFPFKHQRVPPAPAEVPEGFRVVYVYGDPRDAVVSVFRRGFQGGHYRGMRLRVPPPATAATLESLEQFLDAGTDEFGLEDHFRRWHDATAPGYPVMFLRFLDLARVWPTVRDFVGLAGDDPGPRIRPRASAWEALPGPLRDRVDEIYGPLASRLAALPPVELRS